MGILRRDHQGPGLLLMRLLGEGDHPATGPQAAVEAQFARAPEALDLGPGQLTAGHQQRQGEDNAYCQISDGSNFGNCFCGPVQSRVGWAPAPAP